MSASYPTPWTSTVTCVGGASINLPWRKLIIRGQFRENRLGLLACGGDVGFLFRRVGARWPGVVRLVGFLTVLDPDFAHRPEGHDQQRDHPDQHYPEQDFIEHICGDVRPCP